MYSTRAWSDQHIQDRSSHKEDGIPSPHSNPSSPQREDKSHPHEGPPEALGTMSKPHDTLPQQAIVMFTQACVL